MSKWIRAYSQLTKTGIIVYSLVSALAGYAVSFQYGREFEGLEILLMCVGLYLVAAGCFAINQAQEWRADGLMDRTRNRPIPAGLLAPWQGWAIGIVLVVSGLLAMLMLGEMPAFLSLLTVVLYNGVYTLGWKKYWAFGAVPGAIPGAMPVVIGFSVNNSNIFSPACIYLFLILFLWQMPHFWALAIRYHQDYAKGGFPVLPVCVGESRALYHLGLYVFAYVGIALLAPWFVKAHIVYLLLVFPMALKVLWEFKKYYFAGGGKAWLPFFLWTNLSVLIFLAAPVMDRWIERYLIV
jgi:protoheme IX farnesyltransferase